MSLKSLDSTLHSEQRSIDDKRPLFILLDSYLRASGESHVRFFFFGYSNCYSGEEKLQGLSFASFLSVYSEIHGVSSGASNHHVGDIGGAYSDLPCLLVDTLGDFFYRY